MRKKIIIICFIFVVSAFIYFLVSLKKEDNVLKRIEKDSNMTINTTSGINIETEYAIIDDTNFYFKVPTMFRELSYDEIKGKYSGTIPDIVFSNDETTINIAVSLTNYKLKDVQIETYLNYVSDNIDGKILSKETYIVDKHTIGNIKFVNETIDGSIYNNIIYFSYDDKLVIISFNLTTDLMEEWENVGESVIESLFFI